jgi:TolB-like protein/Tfp pilus assembly protein PilF
VRSTALLQQLRERGVLRVAASYAVIAWLLLQIADVVLEPWDVPLWVRRAPLIVALLGFPVALAVAWFLELGDRGVSVDTAGEGAARPGVHGLRRYADIVIISVLAAVVGYFVMRDAGWLGEPPPRARSLDAASLAVLPFTNVGGDPDDRYLSEGLSDELRDQLSRMRSLAVSARSSSIAFEGQAHDAVAIAEKLAVAALLEGTLRRDGDRLRVSVQLVDGNNGKLLWSERYDRARADLLEVQDEIASAVVAAVLPMFAASGGKVGRPLTEDPVAYDLYLLGRQRERDAERAADQAAADERIRQARELYEAAIAANPEFAQAHARLAYCLLLQNGPHDRPDRIAAIDRAVLPEIERALQFDPRNSDAWLTKGVLLRWTRRPGGGAAYRRAVELDPGNADALTTSAVYEASIGRYDRVLDYAERARKLDPMSFSANLMPIFAAALLGQRQTALANAKRLGAQFPDDPYAGDIECVAHQWVGEHDVALACAMSRMRGTSSEDGARAELQLLLGETWETLGNRSRALEHYDRSAAAGPTFRDVISGAAAARYAALRLRSNAADLQRLAADARGDHLGPADWLIADTLARTGLRAEALATYRASGVADIFRTESNEKEYAMPGLAQMIALLQATGEHAEAHRLLPLLLEFSETSLRHGARHYTSHILHARALTLAGRTDEAFEQLQAAIDAPGSPFPPALLETDPVFDDLKGDPRFKAQMARLRARQDDLQRRMPETFRRHGLAWPPVASPPDE